MEEKTQFLYKRTVEFPGIEKNTKEGIVGADPYTKIVYDSFDVDRVIRTITMDNDSVLVLLDDLHERFENKPKISPKTGRPLFNKKGEMMYERVKDTFQSEITLSKEEGQELRELICINLKTT